MTSTLPLTSAAYRSEAEVTSRLQALEAQHELLRHRWEGWSIWPLFRFAAGRRFQHLPLDSAETPFSRREQLGFAWRDLCRLLWVRRAPYFIKTYSSAHMETEGGRKKDIFFDDLLRGGRTGFKLESPNSRRFHVRSQPYLVPPDASTVALEGIALRLARKPLRAMVSLATALQRDLGSEPELSSLTVDFLAARIAFFHSARRLYGMLLRRVQPAVVLLADTGDYPIMAAAREVGARVVEFQHGFTHRHFPANSWAGDACSAKVHMPLPHRIFVYGSHWERELAASGFWGEELRSVGSLRIDHYRAQPRTAPAATCSIVVTAAGVDTTRLIEFLRAGFGLLEGRVDFRATIKTHPVISARANDFTAAFAGSARVRVVGGNEAPSTFELLRSAHLHVSIASTCHYEALALGVPTVILPLTGAENVLPLHEAGHAFYPQSPAEFAGIVQRWQEHRVPAHVGEEYFTPGAMANIERELAALCGPTKA